MGIEPTSQPWQGRVLTIVLLRHLFYASNIIAQVYLIARGKLKKVKNFFKLQKPLNIIFSQTFLFLYKNKW